MDFNNKGTVKYPEGIQELEKLTKETEGRVRIIGTAHSFSDVADTDGTIISLKEFT